MTQIQNEAAGLTVREAALALGLRSQSVYNLLRDDLLKGEKSADGAWILERESVDRYAMRRRLRHTTSRSVFRHGAIDVSATPEVHAGV